MDNKHIRRKIIDSSMVPHKRRLCRTRTDIVRQKSWNSGSSERVSPTEGIQVDNETHPCNESYDMPFFAEGTMNGYAKDTSTRNTCGTFIIRRPSGSHSADNLVKVTTDVWIPSPEAAPMHSSTTDVTIDVTTDARHVNWGGGYTIDRNAVYGDVPATGTSSSSQLPEYKTVLHIKGPKSLYTHGRSGFNVLKRSKSTGSDVSGRTFRGNILNPLHGHAPYFAPPLVPISELDASDPHSVELGHVVGRPSGAGFSLAVGGHVRTPARDLVTDMYREFTARRETLDIEELEVEASEIYSSVMDGGAPRLLSVEEKWQIIFNEKTRAPIYAVGQYIEYLDQFVSGRSIASRDPANIIKKEGINPISYLLRKLKLDLKMSYDSFLEEFLKPGNNGMSYLVKLLKSIQDTGTQQSGSTNMTQLKSYKKTLTDEHDCLLCIKYALRLKNSVSLLLEITYGVETVAMSLLSTFTKSRGTAIEVGESVRFKSLMNMLNVGGPQNTVFKVSTMKFLNCLLDAASNLNVRVFLQYELESAGLDVNQLVESATGNGLEYDDLRFELELWNRRYINVETLVTQNGNTLRQEDTSHLNIIEDLKHKVRVLSHEKSQVDQKLKAVRSELKICFEEVQRRTPLTREAGTQCGPRQGTHSRDVACQCSQKSQAPDVFQSPLDTAAEYFGWNDSMLNKAVPYEEDRRYTGGHYGDEGSTDEESVEKVTYWLQSNHNSESDLDILPNCVTDSHSESTNSIFFKRQPSIRIKRPRKSDFPGNWKLAPKSLDNFPSRFPPHECHQTNCDRCDVRHRPENAVKSRREIVLQNVTADAPMPSTSKQGEVSTVYDAKSQSSDSAIGGSGERLWKSRRIPMTPVDADEAELLQDMIQPDDSASGVVVNEPYPDYSVVDDKFRTQKSYRTELSQVLREFEGHLSLHDNPPHHHYIPLLPPGHC